MSVLVEPASWIPSVILLQLEESLRLLFSWSAKPVEGEGQESTRALVVIREMDRPGWSELEYCREHVPTAIHSHVYCVPRALIAISPQRGPPRLNRPGW